MERLVKELSSSLGALKSSAGKSTQNKQRSLGLYSRCLQIRDAIEENGWLQEMDSGKRIELLSNFNGVLKNASKLTTRYRVQKNMARWAEFYDGGDEFEEIHRELTFQSEQMSLSLVEFDSALYMKEKGIDLDELMRLFSNTAQNPTRQKMLHVTEQDVAHALGSVILQRAILLSTIKRADIEMNSLLPLQPEGRVYKGSWKNHPVVVHYYQRRDTSNFDARLERLTHTLPLLQSLRHPNILQVHGVCVEQDVVIVVMEASNGETLATLLDQEEKGRGLGASMSGDCFYEDEGAFYVDSIAMNLTKNTELGSCISSINDALGADVSNREEHSLNTIMTEHQKQDIKDDEGARKGELAECVLPIPQIVGCGLDILEALEFLHRADALERCASIQLERIHVFRGKCKIDVFEFSAQAIPGITQCALWDEGRGESGEAWQAVHAEDFAEDREEVVFDLARSEQTEQPEINARWEEDSGKAGGVESTEIVGNTSEDQSHSHSHSHSVGGGGGNVSTSGVRAGSEASSGCGSSGAQAAAVYGAALALWQLACGRGTSPWSCTLPEGVPCGLAQTIHQGLGSVAGERPALWELRRRLGKEARVLLSTIKPPVELQEAEVQTQCVAITLVESDEPCTVDADNEGVVSGALQWWWCTEKAFGYIPRIEDGDFDICDDQRRSSLPAERWQSWTSHRVATAAHVCRVTDLRGDASAGVAVWREQGTCGARGLGFEVWQPVVHSERKAKRARSSSVAATAACAGGSAGRVWARVGSASGSCGVQAVSAAAEVCAGRVAGLASDGTLGVWGQQGADLEWALLDVCGQAHGVAGLAGSESRGVLSVCSARSRACGAVGDTLRLWDVGVACGPRKVQSVSLPGKVTDRQGEVRGAWWDSVGRVVHVAAAPWGIAVWDTRAEWRESSSWWAPWRSVWSGKGSWIPSWRPAWDKDDSATATATATATQIGPEMVRGVATDHTCPESPLLLGSHGTVARFEPRMSALLPANTPRLLPAFAAPQASHVAIQSGAGRRWVVARDVQGALIAVPWTPFQSGHAKETESESLSRESLIRIAPGGNPSAPFEVFVV
eukprot:TRINITY_DN1591_c0_g3_i2.p1 TRINITY_DN1591_c0_g3~~TRINITY_DN1591_c0_g3_i2.p1  ORF type:complete len:1074 (-),score=142.91 TRINITY_DN1591_c0_g3_i2:1902-5123(-)